MKTTFTFINLLFFISIASGQQSPWLLIEEETIPIDNDHRFITPSSYRTLKLDLNSLKDQLEKAPMSKTVSVQDNPLHITLPWPDGSMKTFQVIESPIMVPELMKKFPDIKTYIGSDIHNSANYLRMDITPQGFHAMILSANESTVFIDPYFFGNGDLSHYICYHKNTFIPAAGKNMICDFKGDVINTDDFRPHIHTSRNPTCELRVYRLAVAATGEYTAFHGGTVAAAQAAQVTTMNRVNGIYERDFGVRMIFVANNNNIIYTNAGTDPYTNGNTGAMIGEVQADIDATIGSANYDVGHVFGTNSGGLAGLGVICTNGQKARGVTGSGAPIGDPFDIDYVAHELGHQFGANHTQNNNCNRNTATAMEPGSASTIMGYAGICAPNVQSNSDDHFHAVSMIEISNQLLATSCPVTTSLTNNAPTITGTPGNVTIPGNTPFALTCLATDPDTSDVLTYCWEQMDNTPATMPPVSTSTDGPNFRSNPPSTNPTRYFPNLADLTAGVSPTWEVLASVSRNFNFRVTVRDNSPGAGCTDETDLTVSVDANSGPFLVTYPNTTGISWAGFNNETVTWSVAGTDVAPVSCSNVNIYLSTDGGLTYPTLLASNVPNDGSEIITVPNTPTTTARIMVICENGTFFDISDNDFTITATTFDYILSISNPSVAVCSPNDAVFSVDVTEVGGYNDPVTLTVTGIPGGGVGTFATNPVTPIGNTTLTITNIASIPAGNYSLTITATSTSGQKQQNLTLIVTDPSIAVSILSPSNGTIGIPIPSTLTWAAVAGSGITYDVEIATDSAFTNIVESSVGISGISYNASTLSINTTYYWRVRASNGCGTTPFSSIFSFTTNNCSILQSTNIPITISSSGTPTVTSTLNIPGSGSITDVNVIDLTGTHTWISDLTVSLNGPQGLSTILWSAICDDEDDFDVNFDDASLTNTLPCPPVGSGVYQPEEPLSIFNGTDPQGDWTLTISDAFNNDGGALLTWGLEVCTGPIPTPIAAFSPSSFTSCIATISFTDSSYNIPQSWFWDFGDGSTDTVKNPVHTYLSSGTYTVQLIVSNSTGTDTTTQQIIITLPPTPIVSNVDVCVGDTALAIATVTGLAQWKDSSNNIIFTGDTLMIPNINSPETYFVENIVSNPSQYVGPANSSIGGGNYHSSGYHGALNFTAFKSFEIVSAWVNADGAGPRTFTLASGTNTNGTPPGAGIEQVTVNLADGPQRVDLNMVVPAAGDYNIGGNNVDLFRNNSGANFPYVSPGFLSINNSSATTNPTGYYYYLYDIEIRDPNCISSQDTVTINPIASTFTYVDNGGVVTFSDASTGATSWFWDFGDSTTSTLQNPVHTYTNPGSYTITLTINNGACSSTQTFSVLIGVSKISNKNTQISILPNPSDGFTKIMVNNAVPYDLNITIYDIAGKAIVTSKIVTGETFIELDLSRFPAAVYSIQCSGDGFISSKKLILY